MKAPTWASSCCSVSDIISSYVMVEKSPAYLWRRRLFSHAGTSEDDITLIQLKSNARYDFMWVTSFLKVWAHLYDSLDQLFISKFPENRNIPALVKCTWTHLWLTPHSAAFLMECTSDRSVFLQVLAASAARGRHAALRRDGGVVGGWPAGTQVLLGEPSVPQRLVRSAAHRRGQRHRTPQRTVLPTRQDWEKTDTRHEIGPWGSTQISQDCYISGNFYQKLQIYELRLVALLLPSRRKGELFKRGRIVLGL